MFLAIPVGLGFGDLLIEAGSSGTVPDWIIRIVIAAWLLFAARRVAKQIRKEREEEMRKDSRATLRRRFRDPQAAAAHRTHPRWQSPRVRGQPS